MKLNDILIFGVIESDKSGEEWKGARMGLNRGMNDDSWSNIRYRNY